MNPNLHHRRLWSLDELSRRDVQALLTTAEGLKRAADAGDPHRLLRGKNLALLCDAQTDERCEVFNRAATELGAHVARIRPSDSRVEGRGVVPETARVLGRLYDAIECEGMAPALVEDVERDAGVPVYNGLCSDAHPTRVLADLLTMQERSGKPLAGMAVCFVGDPRSDHGDALLQAAALLGMDLRVVTPTGETPLPERLTRAKSLSHDSGARLSFSKSRSKGMAGVDFICDDTGTAAGQRPALMAGSVVDAAASCETEQQRNQLFMLQALLISTIS
ncbi:ornithine carbamoyltransferase subunit F [Piscinibacter sp.]|jgi:ornithine carbamoyltransferase|uniref:ornithine carbamoyltransferase subunit F n=1 Tax=Piscinibacter sp. TaxID=1903157 RepID=UPI00355A3043